MLEKKLESELLERPENKKILIKLDPLAEIEKKGRFLLSQVTFIFLI